MLVCACEDEVDVAKHVAIADVPVALFSHNSFFGRVCGRNPKNTVYNSTCCTYLYAQVD